MKRACLLLILCLEALWLCAAPAWAEPPEAREGREDGRRLLPEERERLRQQMRDMWKSLPPEERKTYKRTHQEYEAKMRQCRESQENQEKSRECLRWEHLYYFQNASPEERERLRELLRHHYRPGRGDNNKPERRPGHRPPDEPSLPEAK
jgi:hypothetical protein